MPSKKSITLQEFHEEFQNRMNRMESSQNAVLAELATINSRLSSLEEITAGLRVRLDALHGLAEKLDKRFERLEERFDRFEAERLAQRVAILEHKITEIEKSNRN